MNFRKQNMFSRLKANQFNHEKKAFKLFSSIIHDSRLNSMVIYIIIVIVTIIIIINLIIHSYFNSSLFSGEVICSVDSLTRFFTLCLFFIGKNLFLC